MRSCRVLRSIRGITPERLSRLIDDGYRPWSLARLERYVEARRVRLAGPAGQQVQRAWRHLEDALLRHVLEVDPHRLEAHKGSWQWRENTAWMTVELAARLRVLTPIAAARRDDAETRELEHAWRQVTESGQADPLGPYPDRYARWRARYLERINAQLERPILRHQAARPRPGETLRPLWTAGPATARGNSLETVIGRPGATVTVSSREGGALTFADGSYITDTLDFRTTPDTVPVPLHYGLVGGVDEPLLDDHERVGQLARELSDMRAASEAAVVVGQAADDDELRRRLSGERRA